MPRSSRRRRWAASGSPPHAVARLTARVPGSRGAIAPRLSSFSAPEGPDSGVRDRFGRSRVFSCRTKRHGPRDDFEAPAPPDRSGRLVLDGGRPAAGPPSTSIAARDPAGLRRAPTRRAGRRSHRRRSRRDRMARRARAPHRGREPGVRRAVDPAQHGPARAPVVAPQRLLPRSRPRDRARRVNEGRTKVRCRGGRT